MDTYTGIELISAMIAGAVGFAAALYLGIKGVYYFEGKKDCKCKNK